jgi:hypothetical protein
MNLEALRQRIARVESFNWNGETVYLRKIGAVDGMSLVGQVASIKDKTLGPQDDRAATLNFHATAISKSLADKDGKLVCDSQEGIDVLKQLNFDDLTSLGDIVLKHSGFSGNEKKSTQPTNCLPSDSASPSKETTTPTNCLSG